MLYLHLFFSHCIGKIRLLHCCENEAKEEEAEIVTLFVRLPDIMIVLCNLCMQVSCGIGNEANQTSHLATHDCLHF